MFKSNVFTNIHSNEIQVILKIILSSYTLQFIQMFIKCSDSSCNLAELVSGCWWCVQGNEQSSFILVIKFYRIDIPLK